MHPVCRRPSLLREPSLYGYRLFQPLFKIACVVRSYRTPITERPFFLYPFLFPVPVARRDKNEMHVRPLMSRNGFETGRIVSICLLFGIFIAPEFPTGFPERYPRRGRAGFDTAVPGVFLCAVVAGKID